MLGDAQTDGGYAVRIYFNPLVRFIWIGALIMFFGGARLAQRPAPARRRAGPRAPAARRGAGRVSAMPLQPLIGFALVARRDRAGAPALAVEPDEILPDATLEARARAISAGLRCLVCQNQSIDDSNAPLARDLRLLVRERLKAGDSDAQVMQFVEDRYGEFVLLRPPFNAHTLLLWLAPLVVLLGAVCGRRARARRPPAAGRGRAVAQPAEEEKLRALLSDEKKRTTRLKSAPVSAGPCDLVAGLGGIFPVTTWLVPAQRLQQRARREPRHRHRRGALEAFDRPRASRR